MNILHIRPKIALGGASEYVIRLVEGLAMKGHKVVVVSGGGEWGHRVVPFATYYDNITLVPRVGPSAKVPNVKDLLISSVKVARIIRKEEIDIINTHHRFAALAGKFASKLTNVPTVSTMHEIRNDGKKMTAVSLGCKVITLSALVKNHVVNTYKLQPERVQIIPMGIHIPDPITADYRARICKEIGLDDKAPIIGCVARLVKRKGQIHLVKAIPDILNIHPSAQFVFVGDGTERSLLETTARELSVDRNVFFLGSRSDTSYLIGIFDFTVLPSLEEEFGIVLIESFAQKKPVIATSVGGIPEIVRHQENGLLVPPRDSKALSEKITQLLSNPLIINQFGCSGYGMVKSRYSMQTFIDNTEALYRKLVKR